MSQYLCGVVEIDPITAITQQVSNTILARIVNPFFNGYFFDAWSFFVLLVLRLLKDSLTLHPLNLLWLYWSAKTAVVSFGVHEPILTFVLLQWKLFAADHVVVGVELTIITELSVGLFVGRHLYKIASGGLHLQ